MKKLLISLLSVLAVLSTPSKAYSGTNRQLEATSIKVGPTGGVLTLQNATDTLVGKNTTDVLTNKSISGASNTLTNIGDAALSTPYVKADGSRGLSADWNVGAHNITATSFIGGLTGNASTATALAADPTDCSANTYATAINASGNLTCGQVSLTAGVANTLPATSGGSGFASYTIGDLLYASTTTAFSKLGIGSTGQVLKVAGGLPSWASSATASAITSKSTTYLATSSDDTILVDASGGAWTLSLPAAASNSGKIYSIKKINTDVNAVTVDPNLSETIDGATTRKIITSNESVRIQSDGTNWVVLDHKTSTPWASYTPTFTGFGTVSGSNFFWRRIGDSIEIQGYVTAGTTTATEARVSLPNSWTSDSTKIPAIMPIGHWYNANPIVVPGPILVESAVAYVTFGSGNSGNNSFGKLNATAFNNTGDKMGLWVKLPLTDWWE